MKAIDTRDKLDKQIRNKDFSISKKKLYNVCKIYKSGETCRYIMLTTDGYICVKHLPIADVMDRMVKNGQLIANGNNCDGIRIKNGTKKENQESSKEESSQEEEESSQEEESSISQDQEKNEKEDKEESS